ncbi:thiamin pyrophosphokinase 2 isoform X1 [Fundulus heteroclitus]|uniref:thiamin pyrophosphokinase 2 isoform X1 n=1 Tax=Fundulus heteroclitus TaxID=8078 RepID=UPI00079D79D4|nr:thiamin pyrophosphokinase 2 isoform X1 [Fundulus heteroclitus]
MASNAWSEKILHLLRRMNNFYSAGNQPLCHTFSSTTRNCFYRAVFAGSSRSSCCRFEIDGAQVGWIPPHVSALLTRHADVFLPSQEGAVSLCPSLDCYERRSEAVNEVLETFRTESSLKCLRGWRDEKYNVKPRFCDVPLMWMERAATSLFGVKRYGVHINGYTVSDSGEIHLWLARRSITKQTYPGLLDNMVAGGLAAGVGIKYTLIKECEEEACIPADITMKAHPVSTVSYTYEDEEGVFPESQFVFDLELPLDFMPCIGDGEVQEFYMLSIEKVKDLLATDDFKPNSAMVVLDFLIRHSFIEPDTEPYYQEFVMGLHQRL